VIPLLVCGHAAFETVGQIGITNFVEDGDDLLLNSVRQFHFELGGHALFMWRRLMSVDFEKMLLTGGDDGGVARVWSRVAGIVEPDCFRDAAPALIEWRS